MCYGKAFGAPKCSNGYIPKDIGSCHWLLDTAYTCCPPLPVQCKIISCAPLVHQQPAFTFHWPMLQSRIHILSRCNDAWVNENDRCQQICEVEVGNDPNVKGIAYEEWKPRSFHWGDFPTEDKCRIEGRGPGLLAGPGDCLLSGLHSPRMRHWCSIVDL